MITYVDGDLFTSPAKVLVNTVNTVGVMGKGLAKEFKRLFPEMFSEYQRLCEEGDLVIGSLFLYHTPHKSVLNFPTKRHWRSPSTVEYIEQGLRTFIESYERLGIDSIAFPQLGCGNGELDWDSQVRPLMENYLREIPIRVYIHISNHRNEAPEHLDQDSMKEWINSEPESLPVSEAWFDVRKCVDSTNRIGKWNVTNGTYQIVDPDIMVSEVGNLATEYIQFENDQTCIQISREDFQPLWRKLTTLGLLDESDFPHEIRKHQAPLLELLSRVDYLVPVEFVSPKKAGEKLSPGLMLVPRKREHSKQLKLLEV